MDRLAALRRVQLAILQGGFALLKPGGRLVYSTCSLEPEECEVMAQTWIEKHTGFRLVRELKLFPPDTQTDGAYAALFQRACI